MTIETFDLEQKRLIQDLDLPQKPFVVPPPERYEDYVAQIVAEKILSVFQVTTIGILIIGGALLVVLLVRPVSAQDMETLVEKAVVPYLRGAATFATTVFGPLLAFILGFYFGKNNPKKLSGQKTTPRTKS